MKCCHRLNAMTTSHLENETNTIHWVNESSKWNVVTDSMKWCHTGWRRLIGSRKVQIIFHKRATKYRSLLRKMTYKDKGSYETSPPCRLNAMTMSWLPYVFLWKVQTIIDIRWLPFIATTAFYFVKCVLFCSWLHFILFVTVFCFFMKGANDIRFIFVCSANEYSFNILLHLS